MKRRTRVRRFCFAVACERENPKTKEKQIPHAQRTRARNDTVVVLGNLAGSGARIRGGEFGNEELEDNAGGVAAALEKVVGFLKGF